MTVGELISELQKQDATLTVYLSKDEEGNGFKPLWCVGNELEEDILFLEDNFVDDARVVVLWP